MVKLDRLTRSGARPGQLVEHYFASDRWSLISVGEQIDTRSAAGRLGWNVLASVAQWEREATGERTSAAMKHKAAQREFTGGQAPYGYRVVGRRRSPGRGARPSRSCCGWPASCGRRGHSLRAVAIELDQRGLKSRRGKTFAPSRIRCLLRAA